MVPLPDHTVRLCAAGTDNRKITNSLGRPVKLLQIETRLHYANAVPDLQVP
jgi:hypothetical protein